ncbi:MAG: aldehyde dehydrogenase [Elainellaceae cyanobacterium]
MVQLAADLTHEQVRDRISGILAQQRSFFSTGQTKDIEFRRTQLQALQKAVQASEDKALQALKADLHKPEYETFLAEIGMIQREIKHALQHLRTWTKPQSVPVPLQSWPGVARIYPEPLGVVLIIAPWNYPFQLALSPLVAAIAAGNCAIIKPSELAPHTSGLIAELIQDTFDPGFVTVIEGGVEASQALLAEKFDHIFFTGGTAIGKIVMAAAAKHLTPVTLELGGKSPCIVDADTNIEVTAKRIAWGKFLNAGQTCIAPDYLLVDRQIKPALVDAIQKYVQEFYGDDPAHSPDYARIVSDKHFSRLTQLLDRSKIVFGGEHQANDRYIAPTLLDGVTWNDAAMQDEIFGPILPVLEYETIEDAIAQVNEHSKPLALYLFTNNKALQKRVLSETSSGGVCVNDIIMHIGILEMPFGGVGDSGMGSYHGKSGFDTFSHYKSVMFKPFWLDMAIRYAPYKDKLEKVRRLMG